jgi:hypothetical protein
MASVRVRGVWVHAISRGTSDAKVVSQQNRLVPLSVTSHGRSSPYARGSGFSRPRPKPSGFNVRESDPLRILEIREMPLCLKVRYEEEDDGIRR